MSNEIINRLSDLLRALNLSQNQFAMQLGISQPNFNQIMNGKRAFGKNLQCRVVAEFGVSLQWLLTGEGSMFREPEGNATPVGNAVNAISEQLTPVRFFEVTPTASFVEFCSGASEAPSTIGVQPEHGETLDDSYCVFEIFGESMSPQIQPHAKVLCREISPSKWHTLSSGVVAIAYSDKFVIKRIIRNVLNSENYIVLGSDNPDYPGQHTVQLSDIRAIFQAKRIISSQIF